MWYILSVNTTQSSNNMLVTWAWVDDRIHLVCGLIHHRLRQSTWHAMFLIAPINLQMRLCSASVSHCQAVSCSTTQSIKDTFLLYATMVPIVIATGVSLNHNMWQSCKQKLDINVVYFWTHHCIRSWESLNEVYMCFEDIEKHQMYLLSMYKPHP